MTIENKEKNNLKSPTNFRKRNLKNFILRIFEEIKSYYKRNSKVKITVTILNTKTDK